jgi:hypothetical protein
MVDMVRWVLAGDVGGRTAEVVFVSMERESQTKQK